MIQKAEEDCEIVTKRCIGGFKVYVVVDIWAYLSRTELNFGEDLCPIYFVLHLRRSCESIVIKVVIDYYEFFFKIQDNVLPKLYYTLASGSARGNLIY